MFSLSGTSRSSSRQASSRGKKGINGLDEYSKVLDSAEKKNRRKPLKLGSYDNDGAGYLSFGDGSDWENNKNTSQKTTKKKRKKRGVGMGAKKKDDGGDFLLPKEKATKKKKGSNSGHPNMTTEKRRKRSKDNYHLSGASTNNEIQTITRVGCTLFKIQHSTVLSDNVSIISASAEMGSDFYNSIAIQSNAIAQADSDSDGNPVFAGVKVLRNSTEDFTVAPGLLSREELEDKKQSEVVELLRGRSITFSNRKKVDLIERYLEPTISPDETTLRKVSTLWGYADAGDALPESNMYRKINEREDDIHPHVNNPKAKGGTQHYNDQHYATQPHIFWVKDMTMDNVVDFFPNGGGSLTDYLKRSGDYNMKWINSHEKKVTKDLFVSALLLEHYKPRGYIDNIEKMNSETLASIMKK